MSIPGQATKLYKKFHIKLHHSSYQTIQTPNNFIVASVVNSLLYRTTVYAPAKYLALL